MIRYIFRLEVPSDVVLQFIDMMLCFRFRLVPFEKAINKMNGKKTLCQIARFWN